MFKDISAKSAVVMEASSARFRAIHESGVGVAVMLAGSLFLSFILVMNNGNVALGAGFIAIVAVVLITIYRLDWGFYLFIASFLVFDNVNLGGFDPWTFKVGYMMTLNVLVPGLAVGALTPMEIHMLFIILVWVLLIALKKDVHVQKPFLSVSANLFFLSLVVMFVIGIATGGEALKALWDIRAMLYLVVIYLFVPQVITTKNQIHVVMWVCIGSLAFKAAQAAARFIGSGFSMGGYRALAGNEDPILMIPLLVFLAAMVIFGSRSGQRTTLWILLPTFVLGFYAANRRAAYISLLVCGAAFTLLLTAEVRAKALKLIAPLVVLFAVYLVMSWNSPSAEFAQAVKSAFVTDPQSLRRDDYTSNLARDQENYNLAVTYQRLPLGLGFGKKHDWAILNWGNFQLRGYVTHNQILWLLVKSGPVGFFLFLLFMNLALFRGAAIFSALRDPYLMAVCAACIIFVLDQIIMSYVDMGLTRFRCTAFLGLLLGLFPAIQRADQVQTH